MIKETTIARPLLIRLRDQEAKRINQRSDIDPSQVRKEITLLGAPSAKTMWCHVTSTELKVAKETTLSTNHLYLYWATCIRPRTLMKTQALSATGDKGLAVAHRQWVGNTRCHKDQLGALKREDKRRKSSSTVSVSRQKSKKRRKTGSKLWHKDASARC